MAVPCSEDWTLLPPTFHDGTRDTFLLPFWWHQKSTLASSIALHKGWVAAAESPRDWLAVKRQVLGSTPETRGVMTPGNLQYNELCSGPLGRHSFALTGEGGWPFVKSPENDPTSSPQLYLRKWMKENGPGPEFSSKTSIQLWPLTKNGKVGTTS